jgi:thiol-disulfide isomerase/thioredoxin
VTENIDAGRRRFIGRAAMMLATRFGTAAAGAEAASASRELTAIGRATTWINSSPLPLARLAGKVVVVDFWTYTCINWIRTLPYRRAWAEKYAPGLVMIGVHTPEFDFEQDAHNVRRAVERMGIEYPVVLDGDYSIWRAFNNHYWPALYFMDARGRVREHRFGEGDYESSERIIQRLLREADAGGDRSLAVVSGTGVEAPADWATLQSPENYLGFGRTQNFSSSGGAKPDRRHVYAAPRRMTLNQWALWGEWTMKQDVAVLTGRTGRIACRFHARDLHLVMALPSGGSAVGFRVLVDGEPPGAAHGGDVNEAGFGVLNEPRLYQLVRQRGPIIDRQFEIEFQDSGVEAFAFTFG